MPRHLPTLLFIAVLSACNRAPERATANSPVVSGAPVIVISIDTLRADHLPVYGYRDVATPAIDALRDDGILYEQAYSHCPMTLPSHLSIFTGLLRSEEHTSELQSQSNLVCRLLLEKKKIKINYHLNANITQFYLCDVKVY